MAPRADFVLNQRRGGMQGALQAGSAAARRAARAGHCSISVSRDQRKIWNIFRSNSLKNGLLPIVVDEATHEWLLAHPGVEVEIDLPAAVAAA
jgi:3-isopropylmalate/(R)-2-methylmalate dehydratase small subunit